MIDLPKKLRITAGVINMGGRIAWGSDTALMEEAAELIEEQQADIDELYRALREATGWLEEICDCTEEAEMLERCKAALAKADGEQDDE